MNYVVDASVCVKWFVPEIYEQEAGRLLHSGNSFHAPELIWPEFANIVWKKVRRAELAPSEGEQIVRAFAQNNLRIHSHRNLIESAYMGAESTGQTVYDWTYLALAVSLSCRLVTADAKFYQPLAHTGLGSSLLWIEDV